MSDPSTAHLLVGTYPAAGPDGPPGSGEGVWAVELDPGTGALTGRQVARTPAPSFLAVLGHEVLAVGETSPGRLARLAPDGDRLVEREVVATGGSGPCHVLVAGRAAYAANYGSGSVGVVPLTADGAFVGGVAQVFEHSGRGPVAGRQDGPHAHSTVLAPGGTHLLAADLGTDEVRRYRVEPDGRLREDGVAAVLPPGTGPRHMATGPGGHVYVVGELDGAVHVLRWADERLVPVAVVPACRAAEAGQVFPAHVVVADGAVLVSVRGADVVARFGVHEDGARLVHEVDLPAGGAWPRHFAVVGDWLVVALQADDRVASVRWRGADAGRVGARLEVPVPACVVSATLG